jgi:hypothetical protein
MALTQVDQGLLGTYAQYTGFKNRLINGAMVIDQRNAGAAVSIDNTSSYTVDRWEVQDSTDGVLSAQQSTDVPTGQGFVNSLKITATTADTVIGSTQYSIITQYIEGYNVADLMFGTASAQTVTLSFWIKSAVTGQYSTTLQNSGGSRINPQSITINSANTWEKKTVTFVGDTSGTWLTTNGKGLTVQIYPALGSSYLGSAGWNASGIFGVTGQVNFFGTINNTLYITGVQLEKGSTATSFDYRPFTTELALAQRYYQQINGNSFVGTTAYGMIGSGIVFTTTQADISIPLKVSMRATPTISQSITAIQVGGTLYASTGIGDAGSTPNVIYARISNAGTMIAGSGANLSSNNSTSGFFAASAEL